MSIQYKKGTFVTVPNRELLRGLSAITTTLFFWICSYSDDNGKCFPSRNKLAKDMCVTIKTIDNHMKILVDLGLIRKETRKSKAQNMTNIYQVMIFDNEGVANVVPLPSERSTLGVAYETTQELNPIELKPIKVMADAIPSSFNWEEYRGKMLKDKQKHIRLIGIYFGQIGKTFSSRESAIVGIGEHVKSAAKVSKFEKEEVMKAIERCKSMKDKYTGENLRWTLGTVLKELIK